MVPALNLPTFEPVWVAGYCIEFAQAASETLTAQQIPHSLLYGYEYVPEFERQEFSHVVIYLPESAKSLDAGGTDAIQRWEAMTPNDVSWYSQPRSKLREADVALVTQVKQKLQHVQFSPR